MSDRIVSWIRTVVPSLWGAVVVWLLAQWPALGSALDTLNIDLDSPAAVGLVTALAIGGWYALWRWLEPRIPDWLTRIVLGSAKSPTYAPVGADGVPDISSPPATLSLTTNPNGISWTPDTSTTGAGATFVPTPPTGGDPTA